MKPNNKNKMSRYYSEEIKLILYICSSDVSAYKDGILVDFTEAIEGRIDILFDSKMLNNLTSFFELSPKILKSFNELKLLVMNLYSPQWHKKIKMNNPDWIEINSLSKKIITELDIIFVEPLEYIDNHLDIE